MPTGGVSRPIIRFSVITTPKCTGSMPNFASTGMKIGTVSSMIAMPSIKQPRTSRMTLMISRMTAGLELKAVNAYDGLRRADIDQQPSKHAGSRDDEHHAHGLIDR